jgi:FixJ family two-component response regulator
MKNVYIIEDCAVVADSLNNTLSRLGYTTHMYSHPGAFLANPITETPAVIILDMRLPQMPGVELQRRLQQLGCQTPIVFISGDSQSREIVQAMKQGAMEFLFKPFNLDELLTAIDEALLKDAQNARQAAHTVSLLERYNSLTPREKEVCLALAQGLLSKQIASNLGISNATIKVHKAKVLDKMQTTSLQELALGLQQIGVI